MVNIYHNPALEDDSYVLCILRRRFIFRFICALHCAGLLQDTAVPKETSDVKMKALSTKIENVASGTTPDFQSRERNQDSLDTRNSIADSRIDSSENESKFPNDGEEARENGIKPAILTKTQNKNEPTDLALQVQYQIYEGIRTRDKAYIQNVFDDMREDQTGKLPPRLIRQALQKVKVLDSDLSGHSELLSIIDSEADQALDWEDFERIVQHPSDLEHFVRTIPLWTIVSDAIPQKLDPETLEPLNRLHVLSALTHSELDCIVDCMTDILKSMLAKHCDILRSTLQGSNRKQSEANPAGPKFSSFVMSAGGIKDFHGGLSARVGMPCAESERADSVRRHAAERSEPIHPSVHTSYSITSQEPQTCASRRP